MEEEIRTAETEQEDKASKEEKSSVEASNKSSTKRGRGRPQGSKKMAVCVTDVNQTQLGSGISNGESAQNLSEKEGAASNEDNAGGLPNGESATPKGKRGRPKGSTKRKSESAENEGSSVTLRGSRSSKKPRLEKGAETPRRGRGRPRKVAQESGDGAQPVKKGRGRPKGSLNKKPPTYKVRGKVGRPSKSSPAKNKRGRPKKQPAKIGRPRKNPLPSPEELKKPRVWKPLGRPRKYPRVDPPEGALPAPRRGRGRPTKSKKGAHLRKSVPASSTSPQTPNTEPQRKRGRPKAQESEAVTPVKRGRPKGSAKKNTASSEAQLDSPVQVEHGEQVENDTAATSVQEAAEEVSNQA